MKKFNTLTTILFGMLATVILGACSCSSQQSSGVSVRVVEATVEESSGVIITDSTHIEVVEGVSFRLNYEIKPAEASNTRVTFESDSPAVVQVAGAKAANGATGTAEFLALSYKESNHSARVKVVTEDGGYEAVVNVEVKKIPSELSAVTGLKYNYETSRVEWEPVNGAAGYAVNIDGTEYYTTHNYYTGTEVNQEAFQAGGTYVVKIKAKGDTVNNKDAILYSDPIEINVLDTPVINSTINGLVTWGEVSNSDSYNTYINGVAYSGHDTQIDLKNHYAMLDPETRTFVVSVEAVKNSSNHPVYYINGAKSQSVTLEWLTAPTNIKLNNYDENSTQSTNSIVSWSAVRARTGSDVTYSFAIDGDSQSVNTTTYAIPATVGEGNHTITIQATGDANTTITDAEHSSATFNFKKLPNVTLEQDATSLNIVVTNLLPYVSNPDDIKDFVFELYFLQNDSIYKIVRLDRSANLTYNLSESADLQDGGTYSVYARAIAMNNTEFSNSFHAQAPQQKSFTKLGYTQVKSISNKGVVTINTVANMQASDTANFVVTLDSQEIVLSTSSANIDRQATETKINFSETFADLEAGTHTIRIIPRNANFVNSTESKCTTYTFHKLGAVTRHSLDNTQNKISWPAVSNAAGYVISVNGAEYTVNTAQYTMQASQILAGTNSFSVLAKGAVMSNTSYIDGDSYEFDIDQLAGVQDIRVENGVLTWAPVDGARYYLNIYSGASNTPIETNSTTSNTYSRISDPVSVSIYTSKDGYFNSLNSVRFNVTKLAKPTNVTLVKGDTNKITFTGVDNASAYLLTITHGSVNDTVTLDNTTFEYALSDLVGAKYTVTVQAVGDSQTQVSSSGNITAYITGDLSNVCTFYKLYTPTLSIASGELKWTMGGEKSPARYEMSFESNALPTQTMPGNTASGSYNFYNYDNNGTTTEVPSGTYTLSIKGYATADNVIDSDSSEAFTVTKLGKVEPYAQDGIIKFNTLSSTPVYQYSANGVFSDTTSVNNNNGINLSIVGETATVNIDTSRVTKGYIRFRAVAGNNFVSGSFNDSLYFEQLPVTDSFTKTDTTLSWARVTNAEKYVIRDITNSSAPQVIKELSDSGSGTNMATTIANPTTAVVHTYEIYSLGSLDLSYAQIHAGGPSATVYVKSNSATLQVAVLKAPTNISLSNGVVSWTRYAVSGVDNPSYIKLTITSEHAPTYEYTGLSATDTTFDLNTVTYTNGDPLMEGENYTVSLQYIGTGSYTITGASAQYASTIKKYTSPAVTVVDGELQYAPVDSALSSINNIEISRKAKGSLENFVVLTRGTDYSVNALTGESAGINQITLNNMPQTDVEYEFKFRTIAPSNALSSEYSDVLTVVKYGKITDLRIDEDCFKWTVNAHGQSYLIEEKDNPEIHITSYSQNENVGVESARIVSGTGTYSFHIRANGTANYSGSGVAYINGDFGNYIRVGYVGQVESLSLSNNVLSWPNLTGVNTYEVMLIESDTIKQTYRTGNNSASLTLFENNLTAGAYNKFSVRAVSTSNTDTTAYILTSTNSDNSVEIYFAPEITDLHVENGEFAWSIDLSTFVSYYSSLGGQLSNLITTVNNLVAGGSDTVTQERFKPFYAFTININGVSINLDPTKGSSTYSHYNVANDAVTFYYNIEEEVNQYTEYSISVRAMGNSATQEEAEKTVSDGRIPMVLASKNSDTLSAIKAPSPKTTVLTKDGKLKFSLIVGGSNSYVSEYVVSAWPTSSDTAKPQDKIIEITSAELERLEPAHEYQFDLSPDNLNWLVKNKTYSIQVTSLGTADSRVVLQADPNATLYLRSSSYNSQEVGFLDDITLVRYVANDNVSDVYGGYFSMPKLSGNTNAPMDPRVAYELYFVDKTWYEANALDGNNDQKPIDEWLLNNLTDSHIINFVYSGENMYFTEDITDINGTSVNIPAGDYYVGIRYKGSSNMFIQSQNVLFAGNEFTKLPSVTKSSDALDSWVKNGKFYWDTISGVTKYKITVEELDASLNVIRTYSDNTTTINNNYYELPENIGNGNSRFRIYITPLGDGSSVTPAVDTRYLSGNTVSTLSYYLLYTVELEFNEVDNIMTWHNPSNMPSRGGQEGFDTLSGNYEVVLEENRLSRYEASFNFNDYITSYNSIDGHYSIKVRQVCDVNNNYALNGRYSTLVTIVKLPDPSLWVEVDENSASGGTVVAWKAEDATLTSGKSVVEVYRSNEAGTRLSLVYSNTLDLSVRTIDLSSSTYLPGYYKVVVKFINDEDVTNEITLASKEGEILVYKQSAPQLHLGDFYPETQTATKPTSFDNYIYWDAVATTGVDNYTELNYVVKVYSNSALTNLIATEYSRYKNSNNDIITNSLFEYNDDTIYFNLKNINMSSSVYVVVACVGVIESTPVTTASSDSTRFIASNYSAKIEVVIPISAPTNVVITDNVVSWSNPNNSKVEILIRYKKYVDYTTESYEQENGVDKIYVHDEVLTEGSTEYSLPFVSGYYQIKLRFVMSSFVSPYTPSADEEWLSASMKLFAYGSGTQADPYVIYETDGNIKSQLQNIAYYPNAYYVLRSNYYMSGTETFNMLDIDFGGHLDGKQVVNNADGTTTDVYYSLNNIRLAVGANVALFANVSGVIENLNINFATSLTQSTSSASTYKFAGIAITNSGTIRNVAIDGNYSINISGKNIFFGMFACYNIGTIDSCLTSTYVTITGNQAPQAGGFVHSNGIDAGDDEYPNASIKNSMMLSTLQCRATSNTQGILGGVSYKNHGAITNVQVLGTLSSNSIGGVSYYNNGNITACTFGGTITQRGYINLGTSGTAYNLLYVGGMVGISREGGSVEGCNVNITSDSTFVNANSTLRFGGIVAFYNDTVTSDAKLLNSFVHIEPSITGTPYSIGIVLGVGTNVSSVTIQNVYYDQSDIYAVCGTADSLNGTTAISESQVDVPSGLSGANYTFGANMQPAEGYAQFDDATDYVDYYILSDSNYVLVDVSNVSTLNITPGTTVAYERYNDAYYVIPAYQTYSSPYMEENASYAQIDQYVGYYVLYNNEFVEVTNDNKNNLDIVTDTTIAYSVVSYADEYINYYVLHDGIYSPVTHNNMNSLNIIPGVTAMYAPGAARFVVSYSET